MRIRIAVPDAHVSPELLNAALEATTRANESLLDKGAPPISDAIRRGKVKWKPEPFEDGEHFDLQSDVQKRGWGDCDDLAPALAAEMRANGDPDARAIVKRSGPKRWHAIVQRGDGSIADPSKAAGMHQYQRKYGSRFVPGVVGAVMPTMAERAAFGLKKHRGLWAARCDLPIEGAEAALCGVALAQTVVGALDDAVSAATVVGAASGLVTPYDCARALAMQGLLSGDDVAEVIGELDGLMPAEEIVGFFGSILKAAKSALPFAKHLPIPGAAAAADLASAAMKGGKKGSPSPAIAAQAPAPSMAPQVTTVPSPGGGTGTAGPIIIRF